MLSPSRLSAALLGAVGIALALANLWFAAVRSTIPLALDGQIQSKERRLEKHPGIDDVFLITLNGRTLQVDQPLYDAVNPGTVVDKWSWSHEVAMSGAGIRLSWSPDARGMAWAMPFTMAILAVLVGLAWQAKERRGA